jgi:hypothetical protein
MIHSSVLSAERSFVEDSYNNLKAQATTTSLYWKDRVQERYFSEYINPIQNKMLIFEAAISQLDKALVNTLNELEGLLYRSGTDEYLSL